MSELEQTSMPQADDSEPPAEHLLTPALIEDEAIRADIMLRWVVVLLAVLLACSEIDTTRTLVHIKSGEYLVHNGLWPTGSDPFSYTTENRAWVNLAWLYDLLASGLYSLLGASGLILFKATAMGVAFYFIVHISLPGVSSWWNSICACIALLACFRQFTATTETITLLGIACLFWLLYRWRTTGADRKLWYLVGLFFLWGQLDSRMFLGMWILLLYGIGEYVGSLLGSPGLDTESQRKTLWRVIGLSLLVAMLHPFGWETILAPWKLYATEYPALRERFPNPIELQTLQFHSLFSASFWKGMGRAEVAGLLLWLTAAIAFVLNRKRVDSGELFVFLGCSIFPLLAVHELPVIALVSTVFAGWNIQQWYRQTFRQGYRVEMNEILFSRGGRAITVLAMTGLAYLAISGRLSGRNEYRIGMRFSPPLTAHIDGLEADLLRPYDDRPFNFVMSQGDILIWIDKKPFFDSRVQLYCGVDNQENLLDLQNRVRHALHLKNKQDPLSAQPKVCIDAFDRFEVTHVIPRLFGSPPDYTTYYDLISSKRWHLQNLGSATAVFYRKDLIPDDPALKKFLEEHSINFVVNAFQNKQEDKSVQTRTGWPHQPTWQESVFTLPRINEGVSLHEARHCISHLRLADVSKLEISPAVYVALAYTAIRGANATLTDDPNNEEAYLLLGLAYDYLAKLETNIAPTSGTALWRNRRYFQTAAALNQAVIINPQNLNAHLRLVDLYKKFGQVDLTLRSLDACDRLTTDRKSLSADGQTLKRELNRLRKKLKVHTNRVEKLIEQSEEDKTNRLALAKIVAQAGCTLRALELLEELPMDELSNPVSFQTFKARLLLHAGRAEEACNITRQLKLSPANPDFLNEIEIAALSELNHANYEQAASHWLQAAKQQERDRLLGVFQTLPLLPTPREIPWPVNQTTMAFHTLYESPSEIAMLKFQAVLSYLEAGQNRDAEKLLRETVSEYPNTPLRPLMRFYLLQLSAELIDFEPPSNWIPIEEEMFTPGSKTE